MQNQINYCLHVILKRLKKTKILKRMGGADMNAAQDVVTEEY